MIIEIDQSGKVEETAKDTVVAFSNGIQRSIRLSRREKRKLQRFFRKVGRPRMYAYQVFTTLIFLLVRPYLKRLDRMVIDVEYPGQDTLLRNLLAEKIRVIYPDFDTELIIFRLIGKKSAAHNYAWSTYTKGRKPDMDVTAKNILAALIVPE